MELQLHIPDDVALAIQGEGLDISRAALEGLAIEGYRGGWLSGGQVSRLLSFSTPMEVHAFLKANDVYLNYSLEALKQDLASLDSTEGTVVR